MGAVDLKTKLQDGLRRHPRVEYQKLFVTVEDCQRIAAGLPQFVPFGGNSYAGCIWVLDWDHRLPSRGLVVRLYAYYEAEALRAGERAWQRRCDQIAKEDLFPEFDVSDFSGLQADEAYEGELELPDKVPTRYRLASPWRRDVGEDEARQAELITRQSKEFQTVYQEIKGRPAGLGDLEAAEWASPSETGHDRWAVEVWYLRSFNGMVGEGTAFLVDLSDARVISQREFQFRAG